MIESLVDFLFANIAFIIVVVGGIISIIKRVNQGKEAEKKIKPFIPKQKDFNPIDKLPQEECEAPNNTRATVEIRPEPYCVNELKEFAIQEIENMNHPVQRKTQPTNQGNMILKQNQTINLNVKKVNKNKVIEGIMWGEILGPPRAKKKYSYTGFKRG